MTDSPHIFKCRCAANAFAWAIASLLCFCIQSGCGPRPEAAFRLDTEGLPTDALDIPRREAVATTMQAWFGTPDAPDAPPEADIDSARVRMAAGGTTRDLDGHRQGLYRQHCATCHGISGDGAGPLATTFDPYPRDFRQGLLKYTSTIATARAARDDLRKAVRNGFPATGMPAFSSLPDEEIDALAEYVRYLGIRGQTEQMLIDRLVSGGEYLPLSQEAKQYVLDYGTARFAKEWELPETDPSACVITPPSRPTYDSAALDAAIARGKELYASDNVKCITCHGVDGLGDGENSDLWDEWNKPKHGVNDAETARLAERFRLPIQKLRPRDFHLGLFRGGATDDDLYRRIHAGIKGTPMTPSGASPGVDALLTDSQIWDVIAYVRSFHE